MRSCRESDTDPHHYPLLLPCLSQDAEPPKLELPTLEENGICEDRDCPGPHKSLSPKSAPTTKGQAGDGPGLEPTELPLSLESEHHNAMELEKVRMEFELTRLKYLHQENERQRQHEEVMEQLQQQQQQQALPRQVAEWGSGLRLSCTGVAMQPVCWSQVWLRGGEHHVAAYPLVLRSVCRMA